MVSLKDKLICLDAFDSTVSLSKLYRKMIESNALESLEITEQIQKQPDFENASQLLTKVIAAAAVTERYPSVGSGEELRIQTEDFADHAL